MWTMKTEFVTDAPLEHGNWSAVMLDTEDEAMVWWNAKPTLSHHVRVMTLTNPDGQVMKTRTVTVGDVA